MTALRAAELVARHDVIATSPSDWLLSDGPEMGPGEDIYLDGPEGRRAFVNLDGDDVKIEIERPRGRDPLVLSMTRAGIADFLDEAPAAGP